MPDADLSQLPATLAAKIEIDIEAGCWLWCAARTKQGYGHVYWKGQRPATHRLVYELLVGPIPYALVLDHLCKVKPCCNPAHLEPVTLVENSRRATALPTEEAERRRLERYRQRHSDPAYQERQRERRRDPAYLEAQRERWHKRYQKLRLDPAWMEQQRRRQRQRLLDPRQQERNREQARAWRLDPVNREQQRQAQREWKRRGRGGVRSRQPGSGQQSLL